MAVAPAGVERLRERLEPLEVEALLVTHPINMRYLVGFTGDVGLLLVSRDAVELAVDPRYTEQARREVSGETAIRETRRKWEEALAEMVAEQGLRVIGIEGDHVTVSQYERWLHALPEGVRLQPFSGEVETLRAVKRPEEIAAIEQAVALTDEVFMALRDWLRPGVTELEAAWFVESYVRTHGGEAMAFDPIIAAGTNGAMAHARPSDRPIARREPIVVDIGARVNGYNADLTRTLWIGAPTERFQSLYNVVLEAQLSAEAGIRAGMTAKEADALARSVIEAAGHGEDFGHSLGHGVGLAIHEEPRVSWTSEAALEPGNVCTVEPGIYLPDWGGIRIEDMVAIEAGGARVLTRAPKEPWLAD
ncbi:MAG: M24 family metallopeptidase [Anaerolineae bacterium]